jgi:hypothetical protein
VSEEDQKLLRDLDRVANEFYRRGGWECAELRPVVRRARERIVELIDAPCVHDLAKQYLESSRPDGHQSGPI